MIEVVHVYIQKKLKNGYSWRVVIRNNKHPTVCETFQRRQEAVDWEHSVKQQIKLGKYKFGRPSQNNLFSDLVDSYIRDGVLDHHKSCKDTRRHLEYFKTQLGCYALAYINVELILKERKKLLETPTERGCSRTTATVNRYLSSLSGLLRYAYQTLRWIEENPCTNLPKLKESPKKRRILEGCEELALLEACKKSKHPYLYCITLIGITTGARKGEILSLTWDTISLEKRLAHIKDSKNGRPRRIALVDSVIQELRKLQMERDPSKPLVFASKTPFGKLDIKKAWQKALKEAGINGFVFHGLRHHFTVFGGEIGATGVQLRSQLGHPTSAMTDHYSSHIGAEATRFIGEAIETKLKISGGPVEQ